MKKNKLIILAALAVILALLAWISSNRGTLRSPPRIGAAVLPGLDIHAATQLRIRDEDAELLIRRERNRWVITNAFNYPVDFKKLRNALLTLRDLKIGHVAPDRAATMDDSPKQVELLAEDGSRVAGLKIAPRGEKASGATPSGRYVSVHGMNDAYLVKEELYEFSATPRDWMDTQILNVPADKITRIVISPPEGAPVSLNPVGGTLEVEGLAENEKTDSTNLYGIKSALAYLRFNDIADPTLDDAATGLDNPHLFEAETSDGKRFTIAIGNSPTNQTERYARITVGLLPETGVDSEKEDETKEDAATESAGVKREVTELKEKLSNWIYLLPSYNSENMTRGRDELVEIIPPEEDEEEEETAAAEEEPENPESLNP